jgi:hypothetical protein
MKRSSIFLTLILCCLTARGQQNINEYDKICYCSGKTPHSILGYDNNWQLLWAFKGGLSKKGLDSLHIPYTNSQLKLLTIFKLIRFEEDEYYTDIPILDAKQTYELRNKTKQLAELIIPIIENDIKSLVAVIKSENHSSSQFSIIFSYLLDGLVWNKFEEKKIVEPLDDINADNWPWAGTFWLLTPARNNGHGTNTESDSICTIGITSGAPYKLMKTIYDEEDGLLKVILRNYIVSGKVTDEKVIKSFEPYNLVNAKGEITIPIIVENSQNNIYALSDRISNNICNRLVSNEIFKNIIHDYNFHNEQQAVIISYHEVMWNLLSIIEEKKLIEKPIILTNPDKAEMKDASDLVYIIKRN